MITIVFGAPGRGKTALMATLLKSIYRGEGRRLLRNARQKIEEINLHRKVPLSLPSKPPIYSDFKVSVYDGFRKRYEPYYINGFYFGIENEHMDTMFTVPGSKIFLSEAQRYFDSRKSASFPRWVSQAIETHRQYGGMDLYMDVQRPFLIDLNIRELCKRFIEVVDLKHDRVAETGRIVRSTFLCREFDSCAAVDRYLSAGESSFRETEYRHEGCIFDMFDSFEHFNDFVPSDGKDFVFCSFKKEGEKLSDRERQFYLGGEPTAYRARPAKEKEGKK